MKTIISFEWMELRRIALGIALMSVILFGCRLFTKELVVVSAETRQSAKPRQAMLPLDAAQVPALVDGNTAFAVDLYHQLFNHRDNLIFSPHSLSVGLAMTYVGARGETERQMADALHIKLPQEHFHPAFNSLDQFLKQRHSDELYLLNALWGSAGSTYLEPYLDTLAEDYGAGMRTVDFGEYEGARRAINQWASDETQNRINELLPPGSIDKRTDLVLTNALYLNAIWTNPFLEEDTRLGDFNRLNGRRVSVPMMSRIGWFSYADLDGVMAVDLTYVGRELSMMVILPEMGGFESFVQGLDAETIGAITKELTLSWLSLSMPKFQFSSALELEDPLRKLGMEDAFSHAADFSGMDGTLDLFIDNIYQQTYINVNEDGTEAGSATAVVMIPKSSFFSHPIEFVVDRPFIFLIHDIETGAILFVGHVVDPKSED